ncbi:hypothetical protein NA57DRAFT_59628 [Rhizodiscina lignyota]|uniref:Uncharacterized protein n=1 Tax=Rhizodiscina lignyota TaxID=1504668 RepID=A0A9P4IBR5_9PEZI|nr:hypothetical protein NA57DRAFT_59628 [Rhizodiscina lignyota]
MDGQAADPLDPSAPYYQPIRGAEFLDPALHQPFVTNGDADFHIAHTEAVHDHDTGFFADPSSNNGGAGHDVVDSNLRSVAVEQPDSNTHLAGLLEAVNTATGVQDATSHDDDDDDQHQDIQLQPHPQTPPTAQLGKRKRTPPPPQPSPNNDSNNPQDNPIPQSPTLITTARAAGVFGTTALFRNHDTHKKSKRPSTAKLYSSLRLTPENFVHLQAAAKSYMLDPTHPERQECVGRRELRGKGEKDEPDMVKLKLFDCVKGFLEVGAGEVYFPGPIVEESGGVTNGEVNEERWVWPRDANQIVSLMTPLMRRMVANERQRLYAVEVRKSGVHKGGRAQSERADGGNSNDVDEPEMWSDHQQTLDPSLDTAPSQQQPLRPQPQIQASKATGAGTAATDISQMLTPPPLPNVKSNVLQFIFIRGQTPLLRFDWPNPSHSPLHSHMTFQKLAQTVLEHVDHIRSTGDFSGPAEYSKKALPSVELARQEARAALRAAESTASGVQQSIEQAISIPSADAENVDEDSTTEPVFDATVDEDPGERLRRELELQMEQRTENSRESLSPGHLPMSDVQDLGAEYSSRTFDDARVDVKAFSPSGLVSILSESEWESAKTDVAEAVWLEGCLRVVVEVH